MKTEPTTTPTAPLHERAYDEIRRALISGKFAPGHKMTSRGLAAALGTSDMPVRAALGRLVAEGGLVQRSSGTIRVPVLSRENFAEVMELRALLEARATALACAHIGPQELAALRVSVDELAQATSEGDIVKYLEANHRFKFGIYRHCKGAVLLSIIENLWLQAGPFLRNLENHSLRGAMSVNHHADALRAIETGEPALAGEAIAADISEGLAHILKTVDFPEDDESAPLNRLQSIKDTK